MKMKALIKEVWHVQNLIAGLCVLIVGFAGLFIIQMDITRDHDEMHERQIEMLNAKHAEELKIITNNK